MGYLEGRKELLFVLNSDGGIAPDRAVVAPAIDVAMDGGSLTQNDLGVAGIWYWIIFVVYLLQHAALVAATEDVSGACLLFSDSVSKIFSLELRLE